MLGVNVALTDSYVAFTVFTAPILGVICGGALSSYHGGYNSYKSQKIMLLASYGLIAVLIPIPFYNDFLYFGLSIWVLLFMGGGLMPALTGIMLNSVDGNLRGAANSFSQCIFNGLGWLPAPVVYGGLSTIFNTKRTKNL